MTGGPVLRRLRRGCGWALAAVLVSACAGKAPPPPAAALHPLSIAIIPVLRSGDLTINRHSPLVFLGVIPLGIERIDRFQKQKTFERRLEPVRTTVADALTASLLASARQRGFDAIVLNDIKRDPRDPDEFDYRLVDTNADVIIHVRVSDVGLLNRMASNDYEPYVDAEVRITAHASGYQMLDENFYYGVNGSKKDPYSIASDPGDRWPDFETVMARSDAVEHSWIKGANAIAERIVAKLPPPTNH